MSRSVHLVEPVSIALGSRGIGAMLPVTAILGLLLFPLPESILVVGADSARHAHRKADERGQAQHEGGKQAADGSPHGFNANLFHCHALMLGG